MDNFNPVCDDGVLFGEGVAPIRSHNETERPQDTIEHTEGRAARETLLVRPSGGLWLQERGDAGKNLLVAWPRIVGVVGLKSFAPSGIQVRQRGHAASQVRPRGRASDEFRCEQGGEPTVNTALYHAYRAGNREALARIYRQYAPMVYRHLARRVGAVAELPDIVQEVFIRALSERARARYDGAREYGPFLRVIARHVFVDWARRTGREVAAGLDVVEAVIDESPPDSSPGEAISIEATATYVETLASELKGVYEERFVRARTQHQAAAALGISRQMLRTRERKLIAGLRRKLEETGILLPRGLSKMA